MGSFRRSIGLKDSLPNKRVDLNLLRSSSFGVLIQTSSIAITSLLPMPEGLACHPICNEHESVMAHLTASLATSHIELFGRDRDQAHSVFWHACRITPTQCIAPAIALSRAVQVSMRDIHLGVCHLLHGSSGTRPTGDPHCAPSPEADAVLTLRLSFPINLTKGTLRGRGTKTDFTDALVAWEAGPAPAQARLHRAIGWCGSFLESENLTVSGRPRWPGARVR